jgi:hypothetical protein
MELPEKIEAALTAYLREAFADNVDLPGYFDPVTQIQPGESDEDITSQLVRAICGDADQEMPQFSGNFFHPVTIELLTPVAEQTETQAASEDVAEFTKQLDKHQAIAAILTTAIMVDDLPDQLSGLQDDFTCIQVLDRLPQRGQAEGLYASGFTFRIYAAGSDFA